MKVQLKVRFTRSLLISFNPYCEIKEKLSVGTGVSLGPIRCLGVLFEQEKAREREREREGWGGGDTPTPERRPDLAHWEICQPKWGPRYHPQAEVWHAACFCITCEIRMVLTFSNR